MSWVFIVNDVVYKLKKPVAYRLLDLRTLEARFNNCREEIRLNKRLAADIYIGIVPLVLDEAGKLQIEGKGRVMEWMVKMKRIPEENLLDYAINHQMVNEALVKGAAELLAEFYKKAPPVYMDGESYRKKLREEIISAHTELMRPLYHFPDTLVEPLSNKLVSFLHDHSLLFETRIANGKIIEAHGDLRPEHICLAPQPAIIDALEFSRELRVMDIAEELSFLGMECEMMGNTSTGNLFIDIYGKLTHDNIPRTLINFYKIKKACLRAYLVARHIAEPQYKEDPKWLTRANAYLRLAENYDLSSTT
ncbi:MAG: hypothetical protein Q8941_02490 [Bacteroidota bacterium]|nr:hypothetical protein [Bacteroidota bacterium]